MSVFKKKISFLESEEGIAVTQDLEQMASSKTYNTGPSYSANAERYPDNKIPFVDKHLNYLMAHPSLDAQHYVSNLRLMTRIK